MALSNYAELQSSIASFLDRTDLTAVVPDFITLAEAQINTRLRVRRMISRSTASISAEFADVPDDFAGPISAVLSSGEVLECVDTDRLDYLDYASSQQGGTPRTYAVVGSQLQFWPTPGSAVDLTLAYYARIPALSDANPTNWLLTLRPDIYLYGALVQSAPYLIDDPRASTWGALFIAGLDDLQRVDLREAYGARLAPSASVVA